MAILELRVAISCAGTTTIGLMARSACGRLLKSTAGSLLLANGRGWNCDRVGLAGRSVHHFRLR